MSVYYARTSRLVYLLGASTLKFWWWVQTPRSPIDIPTKLSPDNNYFYRENNTTFGTMTSRSDGDHEICNCPQCPGGVLRSKATVRAHIRLLQQAEDAVSTGEGVELAESGEVRICKCLQCLFIHPYGRQVNWRTRLQHIKRYGERPPDIAPIADSNDESFNSTHSSDEEGEEEEEGREGDAADDMDIDTGDYSQNAEYRRQEQEVQQIMMNVDNDPIAHEEYESSPEPSADEAIHYQAEVEYLDSEDGLSASEGEVKIFYKYEDGMFFPFFYLCLNK